MVKEDLSAGGLTKRSPTEVHEERRTHSQRQTVQTQREERQKQGQGAQRHGE